MDINLSSNQLDGIEAARIIVRQTNGNTKVIMLTSLDQPDTIIDSFRKGALNYMTKSNYSHLVAAIREAAVGKASLQADIAEAVRTELKLSILTPMEREVYDMKARGFNKTQIADKLFKSVNTIKTQLKSIRDKLL
jgi:DNA-binding NarL/FixJ family response regulator